MADSRGNCSTDGNVYNGDGAGRGPAQHARINCCRRTNGGAEGITHSILGLAGWSDLGGGRMAETRGGLEFR
jgi:hypothetical protein